MNDESQEIHHHHHESFQIGLFIGGLVGALLIYFLGTKEGKKLAKEIQKDGKDWFSDFEGKLGELEKKGVELLHTGQEINEEITKGAKGKKAAVASDALQKADKALAHIEKLQERGRETTSNIRKRLFKNAKKKK